MNRETLKQYLESTRVYDLHLYTPEMSKSASNGWKLSIQGKSLDDSLFLWDRLHTMFEEMSIPYKMGTAKRLNLITNRDNIKREQGYKIMTIYIPNIYSETEDNLMTFAEEVYSKIRDYKGWHDIKLPTSYKHYAGGVFYRNDRNENGEYISAN
jgi:hypothetical protein